jgi:hypothetical protein
MQNGKLSYSLARYVNRSKPCLYIEAQVTWRASGQRAFATTRVILNAECGHAKLVNVRRGVGRNGHESPDELDRFRINSAF